MVLAVNKILPDLAVEVSHGAGEDVLGGELMEHPPDFRDFVNPGLANHFAVKGLRKDGLYVIILYYIIRLKVKLPCP
jgi:hypothetical protein